MMSGRRRALLIRQLGEALDLLLPFGLERRRRDHQRALGLAQPLQEGARGDGLNGLAEAHFVGQQSALGEGQVQHPFSLVREKRHLGLVRRPFAALHFQLVFVPELFALGHPAAVLHPGRHVLRNANLRQLGFAQLLQGREGRLRRTVRQPALGVEPPPHRARQSLLFIQHPQRVGSRIHAHLDARGTALPHPGKQLAKARLQMQQHCLDVLASAQAVDAKIHAVAGEVALAQVADFNRVSHPAGRLHAEVREDRMRRVGVGDAERLLARPEPAPVDFIGGRRRLISSASVVRQSCGEGTSISELNLLFLAMPRSLGAGRRRQRRVIGGCSPVVHSRAG